MKTPTFEDVALREGGEGIIQLINILNKLNHAAQLETGRGYVAWRWGQGTILSRVAGGGPTEVTSN